MAQLVLGAAGAVVGGLLGGRMGAMAGWSVVSILGGLLFRKHHRTTVAQLADAQLQNASYGLPIARVWGRFRLSGNIVWAAPITEVDVTTSSGGGGGKGGGGGATETQRNFYGSYAVGIVNQGRAGLGVVGTTDPNANLASTLESFFTIYTIYRHRNVLIHHSKRWCALKSWAIRLARRRGLGRAKVALARSWPSSYTRCG